MARRRPPFELPVYDPKSPPDYDKPLTLPLSTTFHSPSPELKVVLHSTDSWKTFRRKLEALCMTPSNPFKYRVFFDWGGGRIHEVWDHSWYVHSGLLFMGQAKGLERVVVYDVKEVKKRKREVKEMRKREKEYQRREKEACVHCQAAREKKVWRRVWRAVRKGWGVVWGKKGTEREREGEKGDFGSD